MSGNGTNRNGYAMTDEKVDKLILCKSQGMKNELCADEAGIDKSTLYRWIKRGERDEREDRINEYTQFLDRWRAAAAENYGELLALSLKPEITRLYDKDGNFKGTQVRESPKPAAKLFTTMFPDGKPKEATVVETEDDETAEMEALNVQLGKLALKVRGTGEDE